MKTFTILLPEAVSRLLTAEANKQKLDAASLCSALVSEHFLEQTQSKTTLPDQEVRGPTTAQPQSLGGKSMLDVRKEFPCYPERSVQLAQEFVDEALKLPGVSPRPNERGVGFAPNFAWVEYLDKQYPGGIALSFYGSPASLGNPSLKQGRTSSYSRAKARNQDELKSLLEVMRRSYWLKMGQKP